MQETSGVIVMGEKAPLTMLPEILYSGGNPF